MLLPAVMDNRYQRIQDECDDYNFSTSSSECNQTYYQSINKDEDYSLNSSIWRDFSLKIPSLFCLMLIIGFILILTFKFDDMDNLMAPNKSFQSLQTTWSWDTYPQDVCIPGQFRSVSQLPHDRITFTVPTKDGSSFKADISMYYTHNFNYPASTNKQLYDIKSAIIIQHGNLRNGNDYFCGVINSLLLSKSTTQLKRFIVIAPQFFADTDICWSKDKSTYSTVNAQNASTWCNLQVYSSDGWKDGHNSLNAGWTFYSYDVYNLLMERLLDSDYFPNLEDITFFGFSAVSYIIFT